MLKIAHILKLIDKKKRAVINICYTFKEKFACYGKTQRYEKKNADFHDLKNTIYEMEKCSKSKKKYIIPK